MKSAAEKVDRERQEFCEKLGIAVESMSDPTWHVKEIRQKVCINCWHVNKHESEAMWKLYLKSDEGIAIRSTFQRLTESFSDAPDLMISAGLVRYLDYDDDFLVYTNAFFPILHKRRSFEHEHELRIAAIRSEINERGNLCWTSADFDEYGVDVSVDIKSLIESVYLAPTTKLWFEEMIRSVLRKLDFEFPVQRSSLADGPLW